MVLERLDILNFKNIAGAQLELSPSVNCLIGRNGMGKSNLLEAVHLLSFARPFASVRDHSLIRRGEEQMMVKGRYLMDSGQQETISCAVVKGKPKSLKLNGKDYERLSAHIGKFPLVVVSPSDSALVSEGAEVRRRLMDMVISQSFPEYLPSLIRYNKAMENRNHMLRAGLSDSLLYESVEQSMAASAATIHRLRSEWVESLSPVFASYYSRVAGEVETASLSYRSRLDEAPMQELFAQARPKDVALGFTTVGVHRDDLSMKMDDLSIRHVGSQGQVKTFTIALRLAIFRFLHEASGVRPVLLLDDIFDKLDSERTARIMNIVATDREFGQIFVTDTNRKHLDDIMGSLPGDHLLLHVENGTFAP